MWRALVRVGKESGERGKQPFPFIVEQVRSTTDMWFLVTGNCTEITFSPISTDLLKQAL